MDLIPIFILIYIAIGVSYLNCRIEHICTMCELLGFDDIPDFLIIATIIILWLPLGLICITTCCTVDAIYSIIEWFVLNSQIDKDGFENEDFE